MLTEHENDKQEKYYGWIPILTHKLLPLPPNQRPEKFTSSISDTNPSEKITFSNFNYDQRGFLCSFEMNCPEKYSAKIECLIQETGLVSFNFITASHEINQRTLFPFQIFNVVRSMYHRHVHHDDDLDAALTSVIAKDEKEAVSKIIKQFSEKIIDYHKRVKKTPPNYRFIKRFKHSRKKLEAMEPALGEFIYGRAFLGLHRNLINSNNEIEESFQKASDSISVLKEKYSYDLIYKLTWWIVGLTITLVVLTAVLVIPVWKDLFEHSQKEKNEVVYAIKQSNSNLFILQQEVKKLIAVVRQNQNTTFPINKSDKTKHESERK